MTNGSCGVSNVIRRLLSGIAVGPMIAVAALMSGCMNPAAHLSPHMAFATQPPSAPKPEEATVVFMRPATLGYGIQSSVFDCKPQGDEMVGIVSVKTKIPYRTTPGEHLFMIVGESADFMGSNLEAGKTYYALVEPRMGAWKARFSLIPVHKNGPGPALDSPLFPKWEAACSFVEAKPAAQDWKNRNWPSIQKKKAAYIGKWEAKSDADKAARTLRAEDGIGATASK